MKKVSTSIIIFVVVLLTLVYTFEGEAQAYIDMGDKNFVLQFIVSMFFGIILAVKMFFRNIRQFLKNLFCRKT